MQDSISINEEGAHIPKELFGQDERIWRGLQEAGVLSHPQPKPPGTVRRVPMSDRSQELRWLKEHRQEYMGQWVALDGERLISHGAKAREVFDAARAAGVEVPFIAHLDPPEELPFGGW